MHSYNTRNNEDFVLPKLRTNQLKGSFKYSAILTCYLLPLDIRKSTSLDTLKRFLKNVNVKKSRYFNLCKYKLVTYL